MRYFIFLFVFIVGCSAMKEATRSNVTKYDQTVYDPTPEDVEISIMDRESINRPFDVIGEVRDKKLSIESEADILQKMREAVRRTGGHAMIELETKAVNESNDWIPENVVYYKAKIIKFKDEEI